MLPSEEDSPRVLQESKALYGWKRIEFADSRERRSPHILRFAWFTLAVIALYYLFIKAVPIAITQPSPIVNAEKGASNGSRGETVPNASQKTTPKSAAHRVRQ